ncbi:unnamed protein product [Brachionus calyciflorus]|uniref:Uncharacterized protein n=1 Tax=Brachionus calyciflorus TaxID=104777 RepID=A0A814Q2H2_9BILA|nr:unnamed protein product [Brachionus calyciflorus]
MYTVLTDNVANMYSAFGEIALSGFNDNLDLIIKNYSDTINSVVAPLTNETESNSYETDEFTSILDKDVEDVDFEDDPNTVLTSQQQLTEQERELQLFSACLDMNIHRVSCSAHTLQLVVKDGLAKSSEISQIVAKVAKICNKVHKSTIYSEIHEEVKKTISTIKCHKVEQPA